MWSVKILLASLAVGTLTVLAPPAFLPWRHLCSSMIDHIAVSNHFNVVESGVLKTSVSDHYLVYVCRKFRGSLSAKHKVITSRQMKNFDKDLFLGDLASVDWSAIVYNSDDVDSAVCQWSCLFVCLFVNLF